MKKLMLITAGLLATSSLSTSADLLDDANCKFNPFANCKPKHHDKTPPHKANPNQAEIDTLKADITQLNAEIDALQKANVGGKTLATLLIQRADKQTQLSKLGG